MSDLMLIRTPDKDDWTYLKFHSGSLAVIDGQVEVVEQFDGEALFRKATAAEQHTYDHEVDGPYVQVWPEVPLPSADDVYGILKDDS